MQEEYFTPDDADTLTGQRVKLTVARAGVPAETIGTVLCVSPILAAVEWDLSKKRPTVAGGKASGGGFPCPPGSEVFITDWFSKDEFDRHLVTIENLPPE